jgi:hypothetical protein
MIELLSRTADSTDRFVFHISVETNVNVVKLCMKKPYRAITFQRILYFHVSKERR